jgi:uncharacterized membrane protein
MRMTVYELCKIKLSFCKLTIVCEPVTLCTNTNEFFDDIFLLFFISSGKSYVLIITLTGEL